MKKLLILSMCALVGLATTNTPLNAQSTKKQNDSVYQLNGKNKPDGKGDREAKHKEMTEKLIQKLDLNNKQAEKVREITEQTATEMRTLKDSRMPENTKREKIKALKETQTSKINAVLNAKQQAQFAEIQQQMKEDRKNKRGNKKEKTNSDVKGENNPGQRKGTVKSIRGEEKSQAKSDSQQMRTKGVTTQGQAPDAKELANRQTKQMKAQLQLNDEQAAKVLEINQNAALELQQLHNDKADITRQEHLVRQGRIETNTENAIREILNTDQIAKFDAFLLEKKNMRHERQNNNTAPIPR